MPIGRGDEAEMTSPARIEYDHVEPNGAWLQVTLREGRKRQIKRVAKALGHPVLRLIRIRVGPIQLGDLPPGQWRRLTPDEVAHLRNSAGLPHVSTPAPAHALSSNN